MLQFNKSEATNTNAVWIETVNTSSGYYDDLILVYSQSYDQSNGTIADVTIVSAPTQYRNWLVFSISGSDAPSPSGQYDFGIWTETSANAVWNQIATPWNSFDEVWSTATYRQPTDLLYLDRAYVSGSNEQDITQYVSSNENGTYITYNG